jgi:hypothetical protein
MARQIPAAVAAAVVTQTPASLLAALAALVS